MEQEQRSQRWVQAAIPVHIRGTDANGDPYFVNCEAQMVVGNYIGADITGAVAIPNGDDGVYLNGRRIRFQGVNRHSFWPDSGRTTSPALSRSDVLLMKDMNSPVGVGE